MKRIFKGFKFLNRTILSPKTKYSVVTKFRNPLNKRYMYCKTNFNGAQFSKFYNILMKGRRPWSLDDVFALFYGLVVSNTILILAGTTTFVSVFIFLANSFYFRELVAIKISELISKNNNFEVKFDSGIVPDWKKRTLLLNNVTVKYGQKDTEESVWDLYIKELSVNLSFYRWLFGKGIIKECYFRGVRGTIDRTGINMINYIEPQIIREHRKKLNFEIENLQVEDVELTIYQPNNFRPYKISIFNGNIGLLRRRWFMFDMLSSKSVVGLFDDCLFSVYSDKNIEKGIKKSQLRMEAVNIDHLNSGVTGPFGWIKKGTVDFMVNLIMPLPKSQIKLKDIIDVILFESRDNEIQGTPFDNDSEIIVNNSTVHVNQNKKLIDKSKIENMLLRGDNVVVVDSQVKFNSIKASVPLLKSTLSLSNQAIVRPLITHMNFNTVNIPLSFVSIMPLEKFDGAWTFYDSELSLILRKGVEKSMQKLITDTNERKKHLKRVGYWGLQSIAKNLLEILEYLRINKSNYYKTINI